MRRLLSATAVSLMITAGAIVVPHHANASLVSSWDWTDSYGNLHEYYVYQEGAMTWEQAAAYVDDNFQNAYLATITNEAEQQALLTNLGDLSGEYWLGGFQADSANPSGDWSWVTGEGFDFTFWAEGEANDWNGTVEDHLGLWGMNGEWNDEHGDANIVGFILEMGDWTAGTEELSGEDGYVPVPEPASMLLVAAGLAGLAGAGKRRKKGK